jgi:gas vesicle protein
MAGTRDFISGMVWGGLIGAAIGMLTAPRSGEETRALLRERSDEFKMQARETADNLREQAEQAKTRAGELQQRGRELIDENRERIVRTAEAVKQSAKEAAQTPPAGTSGPGTMPPQRPMASGEPARPATTTPGQGTPRPPGTSGL